MIRKTIKPIILICLIFCFASVKSQISTSSQQEAKGPDGRYVSWGEWSNTGVSRWWDAWYFGVHQTITKEDYLFLQNKRENRNYPEDCPRVLELVDRLYAIVPTAGMDKHKTEEDKEIQKSANGSRNYKDLNFEWEVLDFYKKCKEGQTELGNPNSSEQFPTNYEVQPNEEESKAIKLLTNFMVEHVYSTDIATDDLKMINKGYTVYESGMKSNENWARPILETKAGKVYFNEETQEIVVPKSPGVKAELRYPDGSVLNLLPGAEIKIYGDDALYIRSNGVHVRVVKTGKQFLIRTPTAVCGIRGTEFDIGYYNGVTQIKLYEGSLSIFNEQNSIMLAPNEQAEISFKTGPIKRSKIENNGKLELTKGKIPYPLSQAKWTKQNTIEGMYSTFASSSKTEDAIYISGSITSSMYAPNVQWAKDFQKSRESHTMGSDAKGIFVFDRNNIWICGKRGGIAFNRGGAMKAYWTKQNSGTSLDLNAIDFIDTQNGWCVGNNGIVLNTKDGGNNWNTKTGFIRKHLVGVQFVDSNNGWILSGGTYFPSEMPIIYYTNDGGISWKPTKVAAGLSNSRMDINAVWFIDKDNGWIVGANNLIMFTNDGGKSWNYYQKAEEGGTNLKDIQFTDPWNGWICGEKGLLLHTVDGGKTWEKESINETGTLNSLRFNGPYNGWVISDKTIYHYKDEKQFNQYRAKVLNGEWDIWSTTFTTNETTIDVQEGTAETKTDNSKTDKTNAKQNTAADIWHIQTFSTNMTTFKEQLTTKTNNGFVPVGLNVKTDGIEVLLLGGGFINISSWNMEWYNDANSLQEGINKNMNEGYLPTGFSWNGEAYYVFYLMSDIKGQAWQIVPSALDLNEVSNSIQPFFEQNYIPIGITIFGDEYYTLLVQTAEPLGSSWMIEGYEDNATEIAKGVNSKVLKSIMPWGMLKSGGVANVLYIGF